MYSNEEKLVNYLLESLEAELAGRTAPELLRVFPTDKCQLGVLAPRDPDIDALDDDADDALQEQSDSSDAGSAIKALPRSRSESTTAQRPEATTDDPEEDAALGPAVVELSDRSWRPPSSIGMEFVLHSAPGSTFTVAVQFAVYLPCYASYLEQIAEIPDEAPGATLDVDRLAAPNRRQYVTLLQKFRRHDLSLPPLTVSVDGDGVTIDAASALQNALDELIQAHLAQDDAWRISGRRNTIPIRDLANEDTYRAFLHRLPAQREVVPLSASLDVRCEPHKHGLRVSVYLRNDTPRDDTIKARNHYRILADAQLSVQLLHAAELVPVELTPLCL
jgi:hypothetical protein